MKKFKYIRKSRGNWNCNSTVYYPARPKPTLIERLREARNLINKLNNY